MEVLFTPGPAPACCALEQVGTSPAELEELIAAAAWVLSLERALLGGAILPAIDVLRELEKHVRFRAPLDVERDLLPLVRSVVTRFVESERPAAEALLRELLWSGPAVAAGPSGALTRHVVLLVSEVVPFAARALAQLLHPQVGEYVLLPGDLVPAWAVGRTYPLDPDDPDEVIETACLLAGEDQDLTLEQAFVLARALA
jgi:hypothetical protein